MAEESLFRPHYGTNQVVTASTTAASVSIDRFNKTVSLYNAGSNVVYVRTYNSEGGTITQTATNADCPIPPSGGGVRNIEKSLEHDKISYLAGATTSTLHIMTGEGGY